MAFSQVVVSFSYITTLMEYEDVADIEIGRKEREIYM